MSTESDKTRALIARILENNGITYAAVLTQKGAIDPPREKGAKGWEHDAWRVTFTRDGREPFALDYRMGIGNRKLPAGYVNPAAIGPAPLRHGTIAWAEREARKVPQAPHPADILYSVISDDPRGESFGDWCANFGYDDDSRRAMDIYLSCQKQTDDARRFFGAELIRAFAEALQDY